MFSNLDLRLFLRAHHEGNYCLEGEFEVNSAGSRRLLICSISSVVILLLAYWAVVGRLTAWQDELFVVSGGLSMRPRRTAIESVMRLYPESDSPIKFYGPVSFEAEALLIRVFGLSLKAWRFVCFVGVIFNLSIAVSLVVLGGGDEWAQLITILTLGLWASLPLCSRVESGTLSLQGNWRPASCCCRELKLV